MATVYIGLGSNVGDRVEYLRRAIDLLGKHPLIQVHKISAFYETEPLEYPDQEWFINAAVEISTEMAPMALLDALNGIEKQLQRERTMRWGPRTIDLDVLLYGDELIAEPRLQVPHIRMHDRAFVLVPLHDIAPEVLHPILGTSIRELLEGLPRMTEVRRFELQEHSSGKGLF